MVDAVLDEIVVLDVVMVVLVTLVAVVTVDELTEELVVVVFVGVQGLSCSSLLDVIPPGQHFPNRAFHPQLYTVQSRAHWIEVHLKSGGIVSVAVVVVDGPHKLARWETKFESNIVVE